MVIEMIDDPQLEDVRSWYIYGRRFHNPFASDAALVERFDVWLADHDSEVAAEALRNAAEDIELALPWDTHGNIGPDAIKSNAEAQASVWLKARADQLDGDL